MSKFGNLSEEEKQRFTEEIYKSYDKEYNDSNSQLWPEDDEELVKNYFSNGRV